MSNPNPGVFHPGHDELHGKTVVVYTSGTRTFIGRWGEKRGGAVHMMGVAVHESGASEDSRDEWVARMKKFGFPIDHDAAAIPEDEVEKVVHLSDA